MQRSDLIQEWAAAWSSGDIERVMRGYAEDVVYEDVVLDVVFNGKDEFRTFVQTMYAFAPDLKLDIISEVVSGDSAAFEWTMSGTQRGDLGDMVAAGKTFSVRGMSRAAFHGDLFSSCIDYWDMVTVRKALGYAP